MPQAAYIYVPKPSRDNLRIGLEQGLWGWHSSTLDKASGRSSVKNLRVGDFVVLGHTGPQARVKPGGWDGATLKRVIVTQVTKPHFMGQDEVWPDALYPERIGIDVIADEANVSGQVLGRDAAEALRLSANKQGSALLLEGVASLLDFATRLPATPPSEAADINAATMISHSGAENAVVQVLVRREQAKIRRTMLNGASQTACALCGRSLPVRFIRAAHIKRRSDASREERLDMDNIMPACLLGCDELFEHGYIHVTDKGVVAQSVKTDSTPHLREAANAVVKLAVDVRRPRSEPYFAWHRAHIAGS